MEAEGLRQVRALHRRAVRRDAPRRLPLSIGHPGESEESVRATRDWLLEARPDDFDVTIITPYPGLPYYDRSRPHEWAQNHHLG